MMLRLFAAVLLALPLLVCAQDTAKPAAKPKPAAKAAAKDAVATVNGVTIPGSRMEFMMEQQRGRGAPDNQQSRTMMREELVNREVVAQEAQKSGLAKSSEVQMQMDIARQEILVGAYLRDWAKKHPVSDAEVQQVYDGVKARLGNKSLDEVKPQIVQQLQSNKLQQQQQEFIRGLRKAATVKVLLKPPVVNIALDGAPVRGKPDAPVTLVEFSDFQ